MEYKIKEKRTEKSMSQTELAEQSGVSRAIISKLESGEEVVTTTDTLMKIANALGCPVTDIFCA